MKLALIFLSIFLAASCYQQRPKGQSWPMMAPMSYYSPRAFYHWPNSYSLDDVPSDSFNPSTFGADEAFQPEEDRTKSNQDWQSLAPVQSRSAIRFRAKLPNFNQFHPSQQRLFFGAFNPFSSNNNNNNFLSSLLAQSSTLVTVTATSTVLTAVISTCVPATQFAVGAANVVCARRRRHIAELLDQLENIEPNSSFLQAPVSPTQVQRVEPTEIPMANIERERRQIDFQGIASSKEDAEYPVGDGNDQNVINQRQNRALTVTFTTTTTSFLFTSTVVKKTLNLAASTALSCLPVGYLVC